MLGRSVFAVLAASSVVALAAGLENSSNVTVGDCLHEDHEMWWTHPHEVYHLEEVTIVVLVAITLMVDFIQHKLAKCTQRRDAWADHIDDEKELEHVDRNSREPLAHLLWSRGTAEFTVLGIIACIIWICNRMGIFNMLSEMLVDVNDIGLPPTGRGYLHNVESVHMHLFVTLALYYATMACSVFVASRWMQNWAVSNQVFHRQVHNFRAGKDCCEALVEEEWSRTFITIRQRFLDSLTTLRKASDHIDTRLKELTSKHPDRMKAKPDERIEEFMKKFPFTPYVLENYRDMLEDMVVIQLSSLACLGVVEGIQATLHRLQVKFHFGYAWMCFFVLVLVLLKIYTWSFHGKIITGRDVSHDPLARVSKTPGRICSVIQVCCLLFCFELTRPIAHSYAWILSEFQSIVHSILCVLMIPVAGLLLGHLLAQLAVVLSFSAGRRMNVYRIHLIFDRYLVAERLKHLDEGELATSRVDVEAEEASHVVEFKGL